MRISKASEATRKNSIEGVRSEDLDGERTMTNIDNGNVQHNG
jgi:hypothetical protein